MPLAIKPRTGWEVALGTLALLLMMQPAAPAQEAAEAEGAAIVEAPGGSGEPADGAASEPPSTEQLKRTVSQRTEVNEESIASQKRVEALSDDTDELLARYRAILRQIDSLRTYNAQMDELLASQQEELSSLRDQLEQIDLVSRDVTPLMRKMIHALQKFVSFDVPFLETERAERVARLKTVMRRADVTEAEKYRAIMEAYQIENEYGRTIEAYRSTLEQGEKEVTVDFLRVGRIALVYQTLDEAEAGVWNQKTRQWEPLDGSYRTAIRDGLRIARKRVAPDMIRIPLLPAETGEGGG
jgi:hypothetical protein